MFLKSATQQQNTVDIVVELTTEEHLMFVEHGLVNIVKLGLAVLDGLTQQADKHFQGFGNEGGSTLQ